MHTNSTEFETGLVSGNGRADRSQQLVSPAGVSLEEVLGSLTPEKVRLLQELLSEVEQSQKNRALQPPYYRDAEGRPFLNKGVPVKMLYATDCWDPETEVRLLAWMGTLDHSRVYNPKGGVLATDSLNQEHVGAVFTSYYFERRWLELEQGKVDSEPMIFLGNAAPRPGDNRMGVGTRFVFAELQGNVYYFGTLGPELSWVKPHIKCFQELNIEYVNASTVFRSRFLPDMADVWLKQDPKVFVKPLSTDLIPDPIKEQIYSVDNFGNIKLGLTAGDELYHEISQRQSIRIAIGDSSLKVKVGRNLGDARTGELLLAPGSSRRGLGPLDQGIDIYCQNGSAAEKFTRVTRRPAAGDNYYIRFD